MPAERGAPIPAPGHMRVITAWRPPLAAALDRSRAALGTPGTWLTGSQRVAIAAEARTARSCDLCTRRRAALAAKSEVGHHTLTGGLPIEIAELVHRITTDSGRMTRSEVESAARAVGDGDYVELVATLAMLVTLDTFALALGCDPFGLPAPEAGQAERIRPAGAARRHNWVETVDPARAEGLVARLYASDATVATVVEALTLAPRGAADFWRLADPLYIKPNEPRPGHETEGALTRAEVELIAARVSALNECFY